MVILDFPLAEYCVWKNSWWRVIFIFISNYELSLLSKKNVISVRMKNQHFYSIKRRRTSEYADDEDTFFLQFSINFSLWANKRKWNFNNMTLQNHWTFSEKLFQRFSNEISKILLQFGIPSPLLGKIVDFEFNNKIRQTSF